MIAQAVQAGPESGDAFEEREPGMRARLDEHWQAHPEEKAAKDKAGEEQRQKTRQTLIETLRESRRARREKHAQGPDLSL